MSAGESNGQKKRTLIFVYGTLKQGFPNHGLIEDLIPSNDAVFIGPFQTVNPFPLVCGPLGIPFLIHLPESGHRVRGELYEVSDLGLSRLDELEGISRGHYERLLVEVEGLGDPRVIRVEAYFAHRRFGDAMWRKSGESGAHEYSKSDAATYVRVRDRPPELSFLDHVRLFLDS